MEIQPEVTNKANAIELTKLQGNIVFDKVGFAYQPGVTVLDHFNLVMEAGRTTALVGSSGSGKSTVTQLLTRFYDTDSGHITIDGYNVKDVTLESLRGQIGIVSQDIILFNGTIRDNIAYAQPDATDAEVEAAAKAAYAHDFILSFPNGYESQIGERGVKLSGGEKQRISIARALLRQPQVIILDEATSALDTESENLIQQALSELLVGRTSLVIAHRLSTIQMADQIVVLEKGKVLESGTHSFLLARAGRYKELYDLQFTSPKSTKTSD
jgi:subfamily B ATP-binding cassette protein MsbA